MLTGIGRATEITNKVGEVARLRIGNLHSTRQTNDLKQMKSTKLTTADGQPLPNNMNAVQQRERIIQRVEYVLSREQLDTSLPGYQAPEPARVQPKRKTNISPNLF